MSDVLVLNFTYEALNIVNVRRAVRLLFAGKAEVLHAGVAVLRAEKVAFPLPYVIRMLYYIGKRRRKVALTKKNVLLRDRYVCAYCGERGETVDHVRPRTAGGPSTWENLVCACTRCNGRKRDRSPEQAQMKLRVKPREPQYIPFVVVRRHTAANECGKYLGLYNVSIEDRPA